MSLDYSRAAAACFRMLAVVVACVPLTLAHAAASGLEPVTLQLKWRHQFQFAGYYVAQEKGYYRDAGLDVTILEGMPGQDSVEDLVSGRAQYAVGMPALMVDHAKGAPLVVLAAIFQHSPEVLLTLESSGIKSPKDLSGKRLAIEPISTPAIMAMLDAVGLDTSEYTSVPLLYEAGQLLRGEADAMAAYDTDEPYNLAVEGHPYRIIRPNTYGIDFYGDCLYTSVAELEAYPARVERFREASLRGWRDAMEDIDGAIAIIQSQYRSRLSGEHLRFEANATQQLMLPELVDIGHMSEHRWEQIRRTFVSLGSMPDSYTLDGFIYDPSPTISLAKYQRILTSFSGGALILGLLLAWAYLIARRRSQQVIETRMILDTAVQAIITSDERGIIRNTNRGARSTFGYDPGEMEGIKFTALFAPESLEALQEYMGRVKDPTTKFEMSTEGIELTARRRDSTRFPISLSMGHSQTIGRHRYVAVIEDLSEAKRVERDLQYTDRLLHAVIENMAAVFFIKDRQGRHLMINKVYETATGYSKDIVLNRTDAEFFDTAAAREIMQIDQEVMEGGRHRVFEESVPHPDGSMHTYHTEKIPLVSPEGEVYGLVGIATDITERKSMEEELRRNEERLELTLTSANLGLWDYQMLEGTLVVNSIWHEMLGYDHDELQRLCPNLSEDWSFLVHPDDFRVVMRSARDHLMGVKPTHRSEMRMRTRDGNWKWVLTVGRVVEHTPEGEPARVVGIHMDIDDFKRLQAELMEAREAAEAAAEAKARFLANMSHEIRTPLNAVMNLTDFLLDTHLDDRQLQYLRVIKNSSKGLLKLINDVLDLSKIEAGRLELDTTTFHPREMADDLVLTFEQQASQKGVALSAKVSQDTPAVLRGDVYRLRQILINLIGNALKFTPSGEVNLIIERTTRPPRNPGETWISFRIRDTGIGVTPEQRDRIFNAFDQADSSTTRRFGGTGLGLSISARLVQNLGGDPIELDSAPGAGSCFHFQLPFAVETEKEEHTQGEWSGMHILVLDSSPTLRSTYAGIVERLGALVTSVDHIADLRDMLRARNGFEGGIVAQPFDALMLDWQFPGSDGLSLLSDLRSDPATKGLAIVTVVNSVSQSHLDVLRAYQSTAVLNRPITPSALQSALATALGREQMLAAATASQGDAEQDSNFNGLRVLLVEDNRVNQMVAKELLRRENCIVEIAENGRIALEKLERETFDLVLMDVQMPEMDGLEATRHIRAIEHEMAVAGQGLRHLPIVAMTANAMRGDERDCLDAGMDGYVAKPVVRAQVLAEIQRVLLLDSEA